VPAHLVTSVTADATARSLAKAFIDDPMITWVLDIDDAERRLDVATNGFFVPSVAAGIRRGHSYYVGAPDAPSAACVWAPPDAELIDDAASLAFGTALAAHAGDGAIERILTLGELVDRHHPAGEPHFYLFVVGAVERGTGAGATALGPVLERCDTDGLGAYLESSSAKNLSFYGRLGFEVVWEERPAPDGPMMRGMWRPPRHLT
jgi:hypothetical protein